jgi:hypothetical protein
MYDPIRRVALFDFGKHKNTVSAQCPDGECYTLSARWVQLLTEPPGGEPLWRMTTLEGEIVKWAPDHRIYLDGMKNQALRKQTVETTLAKFNLLTDSIDANQKCTSVVDRYAPADAAERSAWRTAPWGSRQTGDLWGVIYDFLMGLPEGHGALLNFVSGNPPNLSSDGHALGAFLSKPVGAMRMHILVYDMNAGEFKIDGDQAWKNWAKKADDFYKPGMGEFSRCEAHHVWHK